jgi:hydrogenase expression/formation protein HypD
MKYVDEFRDPGQAKKILKAIEKLCSEIKLASNLIININNFFNLRWNT